MPFPSPSRLERFLRPYESTRGLPLRVWGIDVGLFPARVPTMDSEMFGHPPRLVLLGAGDDGLAIVRQTHDGMEDLDGVLVPWASVRRLERDPHLVRDLVHVELAGLPSHVVAVSNHVLLPHNRASAKALCDWRLRGPATGTLDFHGLEGPRGGSVRLEVPGPR
jgi:hypothetical protein